MVKQFQARKKNDAHKKKDWNSRLESDEDMTTNIYR